MKIVAHKLKGHGISHKRTKNLGSPPEFGNDTFPDSIVIHYTAMSSLDGAVNALTKRKPKNNASAHCIVGKAGEIVQLAPFNFKTWHAGKSEYNGRKFYNQYAIGIEIDNLGWLEKYSGFYSRPELLNYNIRVPAKDVVKAEHKEPGVNHLYWQKYTQEQISAVKRISLLLKENYPIREVLGHDEISPGRKQDPGPAFPIDWLRKEVLWADRSVDEGELGADSMPYPASVTASRLNIRSGPGSRNGKISPPLPNGKRVQVLEKSGKWLKIRTEIEGWVYGDYIEM
ncbi:MAG: SH3 domain-containing protein [Chitinivibrionales bacterium]|nr:SH3 domain-containing protein [Chitinivibrionales bacterium]